MRSDIVAVRTISTSAESVRSAATAIEAPAPRSMGMTSGKSTSVTRAAARMRD